MTKRGRPPPPKQTATATWQVGNFTASIEDGHYILRGGPSLLMRTKSEDEFNAMCALIEQSA